MSWYSIVQIYKEQNATIPQQEIQIFVGIETGNKPWRVDTCGYRQSVKGKHKIQCLSRGIRITPQMSSLVWRPAFACERVKGFWSAVAGEWRMGLLCAPLLSRGPGGQGSAGKGFVMSQAGSVWPAVLSPGPQSLSLDQSLCCPVMQSPFVKEVVMWKKGPDIPANSADPSRTCSYSGSLVLQAVGLQYQFQNLLNLQCEVACLFL